MKFENHGICNEIIADQKDKKQLMHSIESDDHFTGQNNSHTTNSLERVCQIASKSPIQQLCVKGISKKPISYPQNQPNMQAIESNNKRNYNLLQKKQSRRTKAKKQLYLSPIIINIPKAMHEYPIFYLVGNVIVDFCADTLSSWSSNGGESSEYDFPTRYSFDFFKQTYSVEERHSNQEVSLEFSLLVKPIDDFTFLKRLFNEYIHCPIVKNLRDSLSDYQVQGAKQQKTMIEQIVQKIENSTDKIDLEELLLKRTQILKKHEDTLLKKYGCYQSDSFYLTTHYVADLNSKEYSQASIIYSYALLALIGTSPKQFASGIKSNGASLWVSPNTRTLILLELLKDWATIGKYCEESNRESNEGEIEVKECNRNGDDDEDERIGVIEPFRFKTVDDILISCKGTRVTKRVKQSEYFGEFAPKNGRDFIHLLIMDIDMFTIRRILGCRENVDINSIANDAVQDLQQTIQQEVFIEKYYYSKLTKATQNQDLSVQLNSEIKSMSDSILKQCGYRLISTNLNINNPINEEK